MTEPERAPAAPSPPGDPARLMAELWYVEPPDLTDPRLLAALREIAPEAELADGALTVPHRKVALETADGAAPLLTVVLTGSPLDHETKTLPDVSQTWDWAEVSETLGDCTGSVLVSELLAERFRPEQRVSGLMSVLQVLREQTRPQAIYWPYSQRVTNPATFDTDSLDGVLNVRYFSVSDDDACVMDTLGLELFQLPDVQCHYRGYDPGELAAMLYGTGVYLFSAGDVIDDGHTISGVRGDERFVCRHEQALIPPARAVLDVNLGEPYAVAR